MIKLEYGNNCSLFKRFFPCHSLWCIGTFVNTRFTSVSWSFGQSTGLLGRGINLSQGLYLHKTTKTQNKHTHQISMPAAGFETMITASEWVKIAHASVRSATVGGHLKDYNVAFRSRDSSVGIATGYGLDERDRSSSPGRFKNFHVSTSSRPVLGFTQPPI
jgi:hypothetical protein